MEEKTHCTISTLKESGWTDGLIKKQLGEPDLLVKNPVYRSQPPMRLYLIARVESVIKEQNLDAVLQDNLIKRVKRSHSAIVAANRKRGLILEWVDSLQIDIPQYSYEELVKLACEHYNDFHLDRYLNRRGHDTPKRASVKDDNDFLYGIVHNFLRHEETKYDRVINSMFGRVGKQEAYEVLKDKVTTEIDKAYPQLMDYLNTGVVKDIVPEGQRIIFLHPVP